MTRAAAGARFAVLSVAVASSLLPFYWMALVALSAGNEQITLGNPWILNHPPYLGNFGDLLQSPRFGRWMANTLLVTGGTVLVALAASLAAAYAISQLGRRSARALVTLLLATYAFPQTVLALPLLVMMSSLHLADTTWALLLAYPGLVIPFGTWALWRLLNRDPVRELLDQARIEGAHGLGLALRVLLPLARPALAAVAIFGVAVVFNDYLYLYVLVTGDQATTVMGAAQSTNVDVENPGFDFAAMLLGAGPIAILCAWLVERYARELA
jgi:ABC-type glycerol-3-phosphate transport system permease component